MRKSHKYNELSNVKCFTCGKLLKKRMVEQKEMVPNCFECHQAVAHGSSNPIVSAKEVRTGKVPGRKKGIYGLIVPVRISVSNHLNH